MTAVVTKLRAAVPAADRRVRRVREAAQLVLQLDLDDGARDEIASALNRFADATAPENWSFVMISKPAARAVLKKIESESDKPFVTTRVWLVALTYTDHDTGLIEANRHRLAEDANTTPDEVSRALGTLVTIGALVRDQARPGRRPVYRVNPFLAWVGSESQRLAATATAPKLKLVEA